MPPCLSPCLHASVHAYSRSVYRPPTFLNIVQVHALIVRQILVIGSARLNSGRGLRRLRAASYSPARFTDSHVSTHSQGGEHPPPKSIAL